MQQIQVSADAELLEGAGQAGGAQVQGALFHVLPGREDLVRGEFAGDHAGVAGVFPEPAHVGVLAGGLLALAGGVGVQLEDQPVRVGAEPAEGHRPGLLGQLLIGPGGVFRGQDAGLVLDDPDVHRVEPALGQRREGPRESAGDGLGVGDLTGGGLPRQVQLAGQFVRGELIRLDGPAPAPADGLGGAAGGELGHRGHRRPHRAALQPPRRRDDPHQLIIGQADQTFGVVAGEGVHDGGEHRAGGHGVGLAVLGEAGYVQVLRWEAYVQALGRFLAIV